MYILKEYDVESMVKLVNIRVDIHRNRCFCLTMKWNHRLLYINCPQQQNRLLRKVEDGDS